jgi:hypothetical protein
MDNTWKGEMIMGNADYASVESVFYLFGLLCAYWAQTTGRNPWLWFFLGFFFAPITGLVLLDENSKEKFNEDGKEKSKDPVPSTAPSASAALPTARDILYLVCSCSNSPRPWNLVSTVLLL